ncbi:MAG: von Willebrand factor type A domain-containing protein [Flavobacteriales bacterium]|nr:von Willebrand factor type A domain-containing protein [Flavobacteriales bacterium]
MKSSVKILTCGMIIASFALLSFSLNPHSGTGKIRGKVSDKITSAPLEFATVVLLKDGKVLGSTITDDAGNYRFSNLDASIYSIKVSYVGYTPYEATSIEVLSGSIKFLYIQMVQFDDSQELKTITIECKSKSVQLDENKNTLTSKDIIKLPQRGVQINSNNSSGTNGISFLGNRTDGTRLFIEGHPTVNTNQNSKERKAKPVPESSHEVYAKVRERGFLQPLMEPVSTFSIDVDKASFSNTRRFLNSGMLPPPDAVRIEEFVNYYKYSYPEPEDGKILSLHYELGQCPWNTSNFLLRLGINAKKMDPKNVLGSNLVFLIDVSGSMSDYNKLPLVKKSLSLLLDHLGPMDKVAIVAYAGKSGLVLPSTFCSQKRLIKNSVNRLESGGSTAGGEGIELAYKIAAENFISGGVNRVILATDGDFNVGVSSESELENLITEKKKTNIFLSVLGFGTGNYQDSKMELLADKGNGNYSYIDNLQEANKLLVRELSETMITMARDVKIQIEFNPLYVSGYRLIGYENRMLQTEDFNNDKKDAGEMGAGSCVTALYEIIPLKDEKIPFSDSLHYLKTCLKNQYPENEIGFVKLRYKEDSDSSSKLIKMLVQPDLKEVNSEDFKFAAALAEYGLLLSDSEYKGEASFEHLLNLVKDSKHDDTFNERKELIDLITQAGKLSKAMTNR